MLSFLRLLNVFFLAFMKCLSCIVVIKNLASYDGSSRELQFKSLSAVSIQIYLKFTWDYIHRLPILSSSASDLCARCCIPAKVESTRQNHQNVINQEKTVNTSQNNIVNHLSDFTSQLHFSISLATRHIKIHHAFNSLRVSTRGNN